LSRAYGTTEHLAEKVVQTRKSIPQGLKPALILGCLAARLEVVPFKTALDSEFFSKL